MLFFFTLLQQVYAAVRVGVMSTWVLAQDMRSLFNKLGGKSKLKVVVCGLDGAGKTS